MRGALRNWISATRLKLSIESCPWDFPELIVYDWVTRQRDLIVYVVGAFTGLEADRLLQTGSVSKVVLFEALPSSAKKLRERLGSEGSRVQIVESAVCDYDGTARFYETNLPGSGSILQAAPLAGDLWGTKTSFEVEVEATRLDTFALKSGTSADLLWIDIQGAELKALHGATACLAAAKIVYVEVSMWAPIYEGGCVETEVTSFLAEHGFRMMQLGTDQKNGVGNALYAKADAVFESSARNTIKL